MGIPLAFGGYDALIESREVDAVYLPLPNALHVPWALRAAEAGLHVLVEKPLARSVHEALPLVEAARANGVTVMEGYMYRHDPVWNLARRLVEDGTVGDLRSIDATFSFLLDGDDMGSIILSPELGGGALLDVGGYPLDAIRWFGGADVVRVAALWRRDVVDRTVAGAVELRNGVLGRFEAGIASAERHRVEVSGTLARLVIDEPWVPTSGEKHVRVVRHGAPDAVYSVPADDTYRRQFEHFVEVVRGRADAMMPLEDSIATLRTMDAVAASARAALATQLS